MKKHKSGLDPRVVVTIAPYERVGQATLAALNAEREAGWSGVSGARIKTSVFRYGMPHEAKSAYKEWLKVMEAGRSRYEIGGTLWRIVGVHLKLRKGDT